MYQLSWVATGARRAGKFFVVNSLTHTKCFNHGAREAVARCPECKRHYCRECVTEHEHRLLCASCIAAQVGDTNASARRLPFRGVAQFMTALLLLWLGFYTMGQGLLLVPSTYHENRETLLERIQTEVDDDDEDAESASAEFSRTIPAGRSRR